jgi:membrane associated rhomboid family serine protease
MFRPCQKVLVFLPWFLLWFIVRPVVRLDASWVLGGWLLLQLWSISIQTQDDVAYMAHVGGVVAGGRAIPAIALPHRAAVRMRPGGQGAVEPDRLAGLISCGAA